MAVCSNRFSHLAESRAKETLTSKLGKSSFARARSFEVSLWNFNRQERRDRESKRKGSFGNRVRLVQKDRISAQSADFVDRPIPEDRFAVDVAGVDRTEVAAVIGEAAVVA